MKTLQIEAWQIESGDRWSSDYEIKYPSIRPEENTVSLVLYHIRSHKSYETQFHYHSQLTVSR